MFADETSLIGGIGATHRHIYAGKFFEKVGIGYEEYKTNEYQ